MEYTDIIIKYGKALTNKLEYYVEENYGINGLDNLKSGGFSEEDIQAMIDEMD